MGEGNERDKRTYSAFTYEVESNCILSEWQGIDTSPDIQNQLIKVLGVMLVRGLASCIQKFSICNND